MEEILTEVWQLEDREAVVDRIMDLYGQDILHLVYSYVKDQTTAEDLTQEIFIKCYKNLHQYNRKAKLKTWLWRIAVNHCKDYLKSWHSRNMMVADEQARTEASHREDVENLVIQMEEDEKLAAAVMGLPEIYREVIYLYFFEELAIKEIAYAASLNQNTVKTRLKRAKELLKERLEDR
ncbi:sigma-70 family RNA polymerase sigma factor [Bacillus sp. FJAT-27251]|uniref:sigma-70 family RNA polymerase sigma factor n=1 Tax=Bacillus sp. FJAT-27251 TaxID=1684142 RepID=UPI0006A78363|nr:sigma-70 family RNA polymerase sigma factor [Bacillus sp. FJAT-27251]